MARSTPARTQLPGDMIGTNLSVTKEGNVVSLHFDTSVPDTVNPNTGKSLLATSHGFARIHGANVSVNIKSIG